MQKFEQDPMRQVFQDAIEPLQPTEQTKSRMYAEICNRAAEAERQKQKIEKKRPWLHRWQTSVGAAGAVAVACVAIVMGVVHGRLPQDTGQLEVVTPGTTAVVVTEAASEMETTLPAKTITSAAADSSVASSETETVTMPAMAAAQTVDTAEEPDAAAVNVEESAAEPASRTESETRTEAAGTEAAVTQPTPIQTTVPQETAAPAAQTTAPAVQTTAPAATTAPAETTTSRKLPQSSEREHMLEWDGFLYNCAFETVSPTRITNYLGGNTALDAEGQIRTVVMYTAEDWEQTQELIVQYEGDDSYYIFYRIE